MKSILNNKFIIAIFIFVFSLIFTRAWHFKADESVSYRNHIHGDSFSDINTLSAVHYFLDFGFWKSKLRPMHRYGGSESESGAVYTHYPAFPDVIVGLWGHLLGSKDEFLLRLLPIGISILWFWLIFYFLNLFLKDKKAALISGSILVLSNYFIAWSDTLHKHTFEEFFKWLSVLLLWNYYTQGRRKLYIPILGLIFFFSSTNLF